MPRTKRAVSRSESLVVRILLEIIDLLLGRDRTLGPDDDVDLLINTRIRELVADSEAHAKCGERTSQFEAIAHELQHQLAVNGAELAAARQNENEYRSRIAELEDAVPPPSRGILVGNYFLPADVVKPILGIALTAALAIAAVEVLVAVGGWIAGSGTSAARSMPANERASARTVSDPSLGDVEVRGYTYSPERRAIVLAVRVTPSAEQDITFVGLSPQYSALSIGSKSYASDGRTDGVWNLDTLMADWSRSGLAASGLRRLIAQERGNDMVPGNRYLLYLAFPADSPPSPMGAGALARLTFWSSASVEGLQPDDRFGKEIIDAAYVSDDGVDAENLHAIRIDATAPYVEWRGSIEKTFGVKSHWDRSAT